MLLLFLVGLLELEVTKSDVAIACDGRATPRL